MIDAPRDEGARQGTPTEEERRLRSTLLRLRSGLYDPVTGLCSYALKVDELKARLEGRRVGVLVLDLPGLGAIEAIHGWETADRLLAGIASLLEALRGRAFPPSTILALDGVYGNSFVLFQQEGEGDGEVTGADLARSGAALCGALRARLASAVWAPPSARLDFTIGYALVSASASARFERLVHRGIREARDMTQLQTDRILRERAVELRAILNEARLTTHYQPIVDLERDVIMGYEALTRGPLDSWFEGPDALFTLSDSMRVSAELDALCCRQAVRNARGFDPEKKLFLNALPGALEGRGFFDGPFRSALREIDLQPRNLVLEISERTGIEDFEAFGRDLALLRREGFLVAIDDVGTGYSSLQAITEVQPDYLKIDISLVKNIHQSLIKQELVRSLLQVAARLGAQVIAEGIECVSEFQALRGCGVRYGQGFYLARPAPLCSARPERSEGAAP